MVKPLSFAWSKPEAGLCGRTVEAVEQPIAAPASSPAGEPVRIWFVRGVRRQSLAFGFARALHTGAKARAEHDADCGGTVRPLRCACAFTDACTWVPRHDVRAPPHVCVAATWQFFGLRVGWPSRWGSSSARRSSRGPPAHSCRRQLIQYKEDRWPRRPQRASA